MKTKLWRRRIGATKRCAMGRASTRRELREQVKQAYALVHRIRRFPFSYEFTFCRHLATYRNALGDLICGICGDLLDED